MEYIITLILGILIGIALNSQDSEEYNKESDSGPWYECDVCSKLLDDCKCHLRKR